MHRSHLTGAAFALISGGLVIAPLPAHAADVYQLRAGLYAIICEDGQIFSYSGGEDGLSVVVPALCEGHGGVVGGGDDGGISPASASAELERLMQRCAGEARPVAGMRDAASCPEQMRTRALEAAPAREAN